MNTATASIFGTAIVVAALVIAVSPRFNATDAPAKSTAGRFQFHEFPIYSKDGMGTLISRELYVLDTETGRVSKRAETGAWIEEETKIGSKP
jgi:hypothetical protein